jgi:hypothetical protein
MGPFGIYYGVTATLAAIAMVYNEMRNHPDQDMAKTLRAAQKEAVDRASNKLFYAEQTHERFQQANRAGWEDIVKTKQGLDEGWISPAERGIVGGGVSARDLPMVRLMAANLGMDPQELVARFDPARSGMYIPIDKRGEVPPRPLASLLPKPETQIMRPTQVGPAQMNPLRGFGE